MSRLACLLSLGFLLGVPATALGQAVDGELVDRGEPLEEADEAAEEAEDEARSAAEGDGPGTSEANAAAQPAASVNPYALTPRVRVRSDTVMRFQSAYVLSTQESGAPSGEQLFWQRVAQLPVYERLSVDARDLAGGHVNVHFSGWGALDLALDSEQGLVAGDFAIGYAEAHYQGASAWGGRRFLAWGIPGGLHVDGGGAAIRLADGLVAEAAIGRPVTPRRNALLGQRPDFSQPTLAYGARLAYASPGRLNAAVSYMDRWAGGISADRSVSLDATLRLVPEVDLSGNVSLDVNSIGVEQAGLRAMFLVSRKLTTDLGWEHVDPTRMLPLWSIMAAFASSVFDEVAGGATLRASDNWSIRGVAGVRLYSFDGVTAGYRFEALARYVDVTSGLRSFLSVSRRDDGAMGLNVLHASVALPPLWDRVIVALQGAVALDDQVEREAVLARFSADWPVDGGLNIGASIDWSRSPITNSDVRGQLSFSYRPEDVE